MPRGVISQCCVCEVRIREDARKYSATASLLMKVYVAVKVEKCVKLGDCLCKACRNKYDKWRRVMGGDFEQLDSPLEDYSNDQDEESTPMELDIAGTMATAIKNESDSDEEDNKNKLIQFTVWRTSKSHRSCLVCNTTDSKSMRVLSKQQRIMVFLKRGIFVPEKSRCCSKHLYRKQLIWEALNSVQRSQLDELLLNSSDVENLFKDCQSAINKVNSFDFDDPASLSDQDYKTMTGISRDNFNDLLDELTTMRNSRVRPVRVALAVFLVKLRLGLSNSVLACMFQLKCKKTVSRICHQMRTALIKDFVPKYLGFQHMNRHTVLTDHQSVIATELLTENPEQIVLIADGTYLYCQKSSNNEFQRRTYSSHKHRHLVKPMIITASDGYILSVLGPFFADSSNNDSAILKHCMLNNEQEVLTWLRHDDLIILDRGFRDVVNVLLRLGLKTVMPAFLHKKKQFSAQEANRTRFVTKTRWVIESVNGKIKTWKFFAQTIPNSSLPFVGDYLDITCAIINKFYSPVIKDIDAAKEMAAKMREMWHDENALKNRLEQYDADMKLHWSKYDAATCLFPSLTENDVRDLTFGSYQIKMAKSYIVEHLHPSDINEEQMEFTVELCRENEDLIRARFQSRHSNRKRHVATIQFNEKDEQPIQGWYCTCASGAREVGMCSHVTALIWHLGVQRAVVPTSVHPLAAVNLLNAVDDSMKFSDDENNSDEEDELRVPATTLTNEDVSSDDSDW